MKAQDGKIFVNNERKNSIFLFFLKRIKKQNTFVFSFLIIIKNKY